jgi:hypothetical protein
MPRRIRTPAFALLAALVLVSPDAAAQSTSTATITQSGQLNPLRIVNGQTVDPRPQNLNPLGVNYSDCINDMVLRFNVVVSGFTGIQNLQVWATKSGSCAAPSSRGVNATAAACWLVNPGFTAQVYNSPTSLTFDVRVQDLVGEQNAPPLSANYVRQGPSACTVQSTFAAVPMDIFFLPLISDGTVSGTQFDYQLSADLIGPPAPATPTLADGDTLFLIRWTPNTDSDTAGYDLFIDPIPGQEDASASAPATTDASILVCPDATTSQAEASVDLDASGDGDDAGSAAEASIAEASSPTTDAACYSVPVNVGGSYNQSGSTTCTSSLLSNGIVQEGGVVQEVDEAGNPIEGGVTNGSGGLSTIPLTNLVGGSSGPTISDKASGSYTITRLTNDIHYNVVVAAVDGSGNIGPPSAQVCDSPALVNDF